MVSQGNHYASYQCVFLYIIQFASNQCVQLQNPDFAFAYIWHISAKVVIEGHVGQVNALTYIWVCTFLFSLKVSLCVIKYHIMRQTKVWNWSTDCFRSKTSIKYCKVHVCFCFFCTCFMVVFQIAYWIATPCTSAWSLINPWTPSLQPSLKDIQKKLSLVFWISTPACLIPCQPLHPILTPPPYRHRYGSTIMKFRSATLYSHPLVIKVSSCLVLIIFKDF